MFVFTFYDNTQGIFVCLFLLLIFLLSRFHPYWWKHIGVYELIENYRNQWLLKTVYINGNKKSKTAHISGICIKFLLSDLNDNALPLAHIIEWLATSWWNYWEGSGGVALLKKKCVTRGQIWGYKGSCHSKFSLSLLSLSIDDR